MTTAAAAVSTGRNAAVSAAVPGVVNSRPMFASE